MTECWNAFCILSECDGEHHGDNTGYSWRQKRGQEYDPAVIERVFPGVGLSEEQAREVFAVFLAQFADEIPENAPEWTRPRLREPGAVSLGWVIEWDQGEPPDYTERAFLDGEHKLPEGVEAHPLMYVGHGVAFYPTAPPSA